MGQAKAFYSLNENYDKMSDEDLINVIKSGDKNALDYLIEKYKDLVNMKVGKYFMVGSER